MAFFKAQRHQKTLCGLTRSNDASFSRLKRARFARCFGNLYFRVILTDSVAKTIATLVCCEGFLRFLNNDFTLYATYVFRWVLGVYMKVCPGVRRMDGWSVILYLFWSRGENNAIVDFVT